MSEVMAQRQPMKPTYAIPIIPVTNSSPFKHQEAMELKEFKVKVSNVSNRVTSSCCYICEVQHFMMGERGRLFETGNRLAKLHLEKSALCCWSYEDNMQTIDSPQDRNKGSKDQLQTKGKKQLYSYSGECEHFSLILSIKLGYPEQNCICYLAIGQR